MTRINAGNSLANQYAPPFVVSDNVATSWQLRWNADLIAFEAYDPSANVVAAGFDSIQQALFSNTNNQQVFIVPWGIDPALVSPFDKATLWITINGIKQHTNEYTVSTSTNTTTITLQGTTGVGDDVEVIGMQSTGGAVVELNSFLGDATLDQAVLLTWLAPSEQSLLITIEGIKQDTSEYSISSNTAFSATTITFVGTIPSNDAIEIVGITTTGEVPASPVNASNLGTGEGVFGAKRVNGENQILDFKSLVGGTRITLTPTTTEISIAADDVAFANLGSGAEVISPNATTVDFGASETLDFHTLNGGSQITLALAGSELTWSVDPGWITAGATPHNAVVGNNIIAIESLPGVYTVVLPLISTLTIGEAITVKNQTAGVFAITIQPHASDGSANIDGAGTTIIASAYGYTTLYTDGTHFYIIATSE